MKLNMSFKHLEPTDAIKNVTQEKSQKLTTYFDGRITVTWNFTVEKIEHIAHCHVTGNHMDYFGEARTEDLYKSIDEAIEKVERQIRKHKEVVKDHLHRPGGHHRPTESTDGEQN